METRKLVTGLTPRDEQLFVSERARKIADSKEDGFSSEILRATKAIAKAKLAGLDISDIMDEHSDKIKSLLISTYSASFDVFGARMLNSVNKIFRKELSLTTPYFDMQMSIWLRWVSSDKVTKIAGTTEKQALEIIQIALEDSVEFGLDEKDTGSLVIERISSQGGELSTLRGRMIARTEAHSAANASADVAAKSIGIGLKKEWISSETERTRNTHMIANGQKVNEGQMFIVGLEMLSYPGDPNGSAKEIINCRCVVGYYL